MTINTDDLANIVCGVSTVRDMTDSINALNSVAIETANAVDLLGSVTPEFIQQVADNTSNIQAVSADVTALAEDVAANATAIATNADAITAANSAIDTAQTDIDGIKAKIGTDPEIIQAEAIHLAGLPQTAGAPAGFGDLAAAVNSSLSSVNVSAFGVVDGSAGDQSEKIQDCIDYAYDNNLVVNFDVATVRVDGTIYLRGETRGNGVWILNYGTGDAVSIASDSDDIHSPISGLNVTYRDHLSPLNPYVPQYTLNKDTDPRASLTWNHYGSFLGAGFRHSATGKTFKRLIQCNVYLHYYGFRPCGWSYIHEDCLATACYSGFENNSDAISGTNYPMNSCALIKCTYTSNQTFGLRLRYANQIQLVSVNAEKNAEKANIELFYCNAVSGSVYTEYARAVNQIASVGVSLNCYSIGQKTQFVTFFKALQSIAQFTATGGGTVITVPAYDGGTGFGITGFSALATTNLVVMKNYKYVARAGWSKSGADITLTTPYVNGDIIHIVAGAYSDWSSTSSRVDPFLMSGGDYFLRLSSALNSEYSGYATDFTDGTFVISEVGVIPDTNNINIVARVEGTTISRANTKVSYDLKDGVFYNQQLYNGVTFRNAADANLSANISASMHYPSVGVGSTTVTNAHRYAFMLVSSFGSATFTVDEVGAISAVGASQNKLTVQTADAAAGGKLNIYSGTANTIRWNNLTGGAAQFNLFRFTY